MMRVGFVGCGTMGEHMARNIVKKGHELSVYDIDVELLEKLEPELLLTQELCGE